MPDVIVVGAGAAGIFAAWNAAQNGAEVLLLEKTDRIGTKILISGGGKCNICHDGPMESVLKAFRPNEARFIRPSCYRFPNTEIVEMLTSRGLEVYTREDGRIFPVWQTAKHVVAILESYLAETGVETRVETPVEQILIFDGAVLGVVANGEEILCPRVILCTGGASYPKSGTTGDGWPWAREAGHTIVKTRAALSPIYMELEEEPKAGVALRDVLLKARLGSKEIARWRGDLLFTHKGVSGPTVLGISRVCAERFGEGEIRLEVDLLPDETFEQVSARLKACLGESPKRKVVGFIDGLVVRRLEPDVLADAGLDVETIASGVSKKQINRLVEVLKGWQLGLVRTIPLEKGEVTAGGVDLDEVDPKSMRSLKCKGLYLCGEVLDVAGPVGGYNLQAAFATGFVAGESGAMDSRKT